MFNLPRGGALRHVAIVPTIPGREALVCRALSSIASQTRIPDRVILVPDGDESFALSVGDLVLTVLPNVEIVRNRRTTGLSGATNTAIDHLLRTEASVDNVLVSFLDDDDQWEKDYLAIVNVAAQGFPGFLAGALVRYDDTTPEGRVLSPPSNVTIDDFLAGNPGIQGSNLSAPLEALLLAGNFDEALSSCNDRDLVIRLLDLGKPYRGVPSAKVHHDTLHGTPRLSDRGGERKKSGLNTFFAKYRWRMSEECRQTFETRASRLFDWKTPIDLPPAVVTAPLATPSIAEPNSLNVVVGIIVDGHQPGRAKPLLNGLGRLAKHPAIQRLDVVLLENGHAAGYADVLTHAQAICPHVWSVALSDQAAMAEQCSLLPTDVSPDKAIAIARTLLQRFVHEVARQTPDAIAWILDDDGRLPLDVTRLVDAMTRARAAGFDVAIGSVSGAPPVPAASTSRTQLLDLASFLLGAATHYPADSLPDAESCNARWRIGRRDYYYDLARSQTDRLEIPFMPPLMASTVFDAFEELALRAPRIFAGEAITRPVLPATGDVIADARRSHLRGGNTFVFQIDLLRDVPNLSPRLDGKPVRRSDMLWATNAALRLGRRVMTIPISIEQDRSADAPQNVSPRNVIDDILGYAFFRAYEEVLGEQSTISRDPLSPEERATVLQRTHKYAIERSVAFRLSFHRARGLAIVLRRCVYGDTHLRPWWFDDKRCTESITRWKQFVEALDDRLSLTRLQQFEQAFEEALHKTGFETFLDEQDAWIAAPQTTRDDDALTPWYECERVQHATTLVRERLGRDVIEVLGHGAEGVVLRTGDRVVKLFDKWNETDRNQLVGTLRQLVETPRVAGLPEVLALHEWPDVIALETTYEHSAPYEGGQGPALFECLRSLIAAGWAFTNIHPKNLRVTSTGVQIIDLGRSLQTLRPDLEESMVKRAFLSWRFVYRSDLSVLLRRSNTESDFAELVGWRGLWSALRQDNPKQRLDALIDRHVATLRAGRVFDYGCGKPRAMHEQAMTSGELAVFDPDDTLRARWQKEIPAATFHDRSSMEAATVQRFDVVICALVLCTVDDDEARHVLSDLRRLAHNNGRVIVAVCDSTSIHVHQTTMQTRLNTDEIAYGSTMPYEKRVATSCRREVHRPLDVYRRLFARAGLRVDDTEFVTGIDVERFEEVGEFILFELSPLPTLRDRTSLLIKVCAMEADTVQHQVRHLVRALGTPRGFDEVVVIVDPFAGRFPRQYCAGDLAALRKHLDNLLAERIIDQVVEGPTDGDKCRAIAKRWFAHAATKAHAKNGQALLATLKGFDACTGDLVLHADADVMIGRPDAFFDHIAEAAHLFETIPRAVTLALPILGDEDPRPRFHDDRGPYRVETQVGWLFRRRLLELQPLPNTLDVDNGQLELPWHRSLDILVRSDRANSVRRGASGIWFTSPDNARKRSLDDLLLLLDRIEAGQTPSVQRHHAPTNGTFEEWLDPKRSEKLVVVACGRNVGPGRITRFREMLLRQTRSDWGAIIIDDASDNGCDEVLRRLFSQERDRVTLLQRRRRVGALANLVLAIRSFIERPDAIVVLVDLDDTLGTPDALAEVFRAYEAGADVTVGTMVRTDKEATYPVDFVNPRENRGGNVWQHLRTFRRYLFDRIDLVDLQLDGKWVDLASDWAFMLPIIEMAEHPVWLRTPIYLHEPGDARNGEHRALRERVIAQLVSRLRYARITMVEVAQ